MAEAMTEAEEAQLLSIEALALSEKEAGDEKLQVADLLRNDGRWQLGRVWDGVGWEGQQTAVYCTSSQFHTLPNQSAAHPNEPHPSSSQI